MGEQTNIEWCHHTFNPWIGCIKVAKECQFCYAESFAQRFGWKVWGPASTTERRVTTLENWKKPLKWNTLASISGQRRRVFCASLADVYEDHPQLAEPRARLWDLIEQTPALDWLLLTKRPENILRMSPWSESWPAHVWVGTSVGTQRRAKECIDLLLQVPARVRFLSVEPQLEELDLRPWLEHLQWIICGGESGPRHRPFDPNWARSLRDQCLLYQVPFLFKQHGGLRHNSGGRLLDGRTWDQFPIVQGGSYGC